MKPRFNLAQSVRLIVPLAFLFASTITVAGDKQSEAIEGFRKEAQKCKTSENQSVTFDLASVPGKPISEPVTPEEEARIKGAFVKSGTPYDRKTHQATYNFILGVIRTKNIADFRVSTSDSKEALAPVRECLKSLASASGLESKFE